MLRHYRSQLGWSAASLGAQTLIGIVSFVAIARFFGADVFGSYAGTVGFVSVVTAFATLGSAELAARWLVDARADPTTGRTADDAADEAAGRVFSTLASTAPFVVLAAAVIGGLLFPSLGDRAGERVLIVGLFAVAEVGVSGVGASVNALLLALREDRVAALLAGARSGIRLVAIVIAAAVSDSARSLALGLAAGALVFLGVTVLVIRDRGVRPAWSMRWRKQWRHGFDIALGGAARSTTQDVDQAVLLRNGLVVDTGLYGAGSRIAHYAFLPAMVVLQITYPRYFERGARGIRASWGYCRSVGTPLIGYGVFAGAALLLGQLLVPAVLGSDFEGTQPMIIALAGLPLIRVLNSILGDVLISSGHVAARMRPIVVGAVANLGVNLVVIPAFGWQGAVATTYLTEIGVVIAYGGLIHRLLRIEDASPTDNEPDTTTESCAHA
jgi:O-antigen/teichoic acid export membrane protein